MAECPRCKREILWDACQDAFTDSEGFLPESIVLDSADEELEIREVKCRCGEVVAVWYVHPDQVTIFNHQEWAGIQWDDPAHSA